MHALFYNRPETTHQHVVEARYRSVYFGWQQSNRVNGCRGEEQVLLSQLNAVKNASHGRASTVAYAANAQSLLTFYGAILKGGKISLMLRCFLNAHLNHDHEQIGSAQLQRIRAFSYTLGVAMTPKPAWDAQTHRDLISPGTGGPRQREISSWTM